MRVMRQHLLKGNAKTEGLFAKKERKKKTSVRDEWMNSCLNLPYSESFSHECRCAGYKC